MIYDSLDTSTLLNTVVLFHQKIQLKNTGKRPFSGGPDQPQLRHDSSSPNPLTVEPKGCTVADGAWEKSKSCCHIDLEVWRFIEELATPNRKKNIDAYIICIYYICIQLYIITTYINTKHRVIIGAVPFLIAWASLPHIFAHRFGSVPPHPQRLHPPGSYQVCSWRCVTSIPKLNSVLYRNGSLTVKTQTKKHAAWKTTIFAFLLGFDNFQGQSVELHRGSLIRMTILVPSRELTYPTLGSSENHRLKNAIFEGIWVFPHYFRKHPYVSSLEEKTTHKPTKTAFKMPLPQCGGKPEL